MKKRVLLLAAVVALIAGAGIAYAASSGSGLPAGPAVWGGGHFVAPGLSDRDFSVNATVGGGVFKYGAYAPAVGSPFGWSANVTCIRVSGNMAVIAGYLPSGNYAGSPYLFYVIDNGSPGPEQTFDQASPVWIVYPPEERENLGMPVGFPHVCPAADPPESLAYFGDVTSGDIVVKTAGS